MDIPITISTRIILDEAEKRGITVEYLGSTKVARLSYSGHEEYLCYQFISKTSAVALEITNNKDMTKEFLKEAGISVAEGRKFRISDRTEALDFAKRIKFPVVVKPTNSSHGDSVYVDIQTEKDFLGCWKKIAKKFNEALVEKHFLNGTEYRVVATKDKVLAVTNRLPANVIGDGIHTIAKLVEMKNSDPRRGDDSYRDHAKPLVKIKIDDVVLETLRKKKISTKHIPLSGEKVFLRENSNLSTGGDSIDFTDKIHPSVEKIATKAIKAIPGLSHGGIDFLSKDITKKQSSDSYIIVEINASPGIFMHHFPYEGKSRNVAGEILDIAFPETKEASK